MNDATTIAVQCCTIISRRRRATPTTARINTTLVVGEGLERSIDQPPAEQLLHHHSSTASGDGGADVLRYNCDDDISDN